MHSFLQYIRSKFHSSMGRDIFWTFTGQVMILFALLMINKILSNTMSIEDFGKYNIIRRSVSVISFVLLGGLGISMPRFLSILASKHHYRSLQGLLSASWLYLFLIAILVFAGYLFLFDNLAMLVIGSADFRFYVLCFFYALSLSINSYLYAYYRGIGKFKQFNISQIICQLLMLFPMVFMIADLFYIILLWTILNFIFVLVVSWNELYVYRHVRNHFLASFDLKIRNLVQLSKYSFPRLLGDFLLFACSAFPVIFIGNQLGYEEASFYSVGVSLVTMIAPIFSFLGVVLLPTVSKMVAANQWMIADRLILKLTIAYSLVAMLFTLILYANMDLFIHVFFSDKYMVAKEIGRIIAISILPQSIYLLYRNPNDAASAFPFNTVILFFSLLLMVCGFLFYNSILEYARVYLIVSVFQGALSVIVWNCIKYKYSK